MIIQLLIIITILVVTIMIALVFISMLILLAAGLLAARGLHGALLLHEVEGLGEEVMRIVAAEDGEGLSLRKRLL